MLTISQPLSSGQAQRYRAEEFTSRSQAYYAEGGASLAAAASALEADREASSEVESLPLEPGQNDGLTGVSGAPAKAKRNFETAKARV